MLKFSLFSFSGLTLVIASVPLIFIVVRELCHNKKLFPFLMYHLCIFLWAIGSIFIGFCDNSEAATQAWKWAYSPVIFVPIFFYHSVLSINDVKRPWLVAIFYLQAIIFLIMHLKGTLFYPAKLTPYSAYHIQVTPLASLHIIFGWMIVKVLGHIELFFFWKKSINTKHNYFLLLATPIGLLGAFLNYLPLYNVPCYPIGNIIVAIYITLCTYAIFHQKFLDIEVIIKKSLIYTILISVISIIYLIMVFISERFIQNMVGYQSFVMSGFFAFTLGLLLIPLKNTIEILVNRYFFKGSPEELSEQIQKYSVQVQEGDRYKTAAALAGGVAHEIRNPLTAINTFLEKFPEKENDPEFRQKFHHIVSHEVERIKNLATQLMDFSKPQQPVLGLANLHSLLDDVLLLLQNQMNANHIQVRKEFNPDNIILTADKNQIKQVFLNIILNAIDAMPDGGTLTVATNVVVGAGSKPALNTRAGLEPAPTENGKIEILISDTGSGISPEHQKKLFEPFFTTKPDGTGLGLSICRRIIQEHGGKISAESETEKGTTFSIILPENNASKTPGGADA